MSAFAGFFVDLAARFNAWRERERAFAELSALDDRTLADLGLRRADIPFVVYCKARERSGRIAAAGGKAAALADDKSGLRAA